MNAIRSNLSAENKRNLNNLSRDDGLVGRSVENQLQDIRKLKKDYLDNGGTDKAFIQNLNNLEEFYLK